ncbi:MAG: STAS domain-containing protein [Phycisphaerales bacterium]
MTPEQHSDSSEERFAEILIERGVLTARLTGPSVGQREGEVFASMIHARLEGPDPVNSIVLDFTDISFINSAGLGSCVTVHNDAKPRGAAVVLYGMDASIRDVFTMTRLDKLFKIADDEKRLKKIVGK